MKPLYSLLKLQTDTVNVINIPLCKNASLVFSQRREPETQCGSLLCNEQCNISAFNHSFIPSLGHVI